MHVCGEHGPVVSRPHLSLVPANGLHVRLGARLTWVAAVVAAVLVGLVLLYAAARFTSLFAVQELEVTGGRRAVRAAVREAARPLLGENLVALDRDELRRRLDAIPAVRSSHVDRAFPHTLRIAVVRERPLAVVRTGTAAWLVSARDRVIRALDPDAAGRRPVVWAAPDSTLALGGTVADESVRSVLQAFRRVPGDFPERVESGRASDGAVTLVLARGLELRLGRPDALALKLAVAARVLRTLGAAEADGLGYLDVSVPERAVGGTTLDSQLEG